MRPKALGAFSFILLVGGVAVGQVPLGPNGPNTVQWTVASGGNGHFYEPVAVDPITHTQGITWTSAAAAATCAGGYLATITSSAENTVVFDLIKFPQFWPVGTASGPWLGAFQPSGACTGTCPPGNAWQWVTGEPFVYTNWHPVQLDNGPTCGMDEDVMQFTGSMALGPFPLPASFSVWNDYIASPCPANGKVIGYVVEYNNNLSAPFGVSGPNTTVWATNGHAYEVVAVPCGILWADAHRAALALGGYLATPTSAAENAFIYGLLNPTHFSPAGLGPWLGGIQSAFGPEPAGGWRWVTGEAYAFTSWNSGEPNNLGGEERLHYYSAANPGLWNDLPLETPTVAYVIEYEPSLPCAPNGSSFTLCAAHNAAGAARVQLFNLPSGTTNGLTLMSATPATPVGSGAFFGLNADLLTITIILRLPVPGDPFAWVVLEPGQFPDSPFIFPAGTTSAISGLTWDIMAVAATNLGTVAFSNIVQNAW